MLIRCSSLGSIMTEPVSIDPRLMTPEAEEIKKKKKRTPEESAVLAKLKDQTLSETAKTYLRELAAQEIFGVKFSIGSKYLTKGIEVENDSIALLNSVRGTSLVKNTERRHNDYITGECDLYDAKNNRGHDIKSSWSIQTFPLLAQDAVDKGYEWQMRGYMMLWDAEEWEVNYALVDTPERLIGYEPLELHLVSHIPERLRLTSWALKRDMELEAKIIEKVKLAREYLTEVYAEFERTHK